jgi:hypothetical protein
MIKDFLRIKIFYSYLSRLVTSEMGDYKLVSLYNSYGEQRLGFKQLIDFKTQKREGSLGVI